MKSEYVVDLMIDGKVPAHIQPGLDVVRHLRKLVGEDIPFWLAGGALISLRSGDPVNDWDIFSSVPAKMAAILEAKLDPGCVTFRNSHVINFNIPQIENIVQIVLRPFDDPISCADQFDFTIVASALDENYLYRHPDFTDDAQACKLRLNRITYPLNTMKRIIKYAGRGYDVDNDLLIECLAQINHLNINYDTLQSPDFYLASMTL